MKLIGFRMPTSGGGSSPGMIYVNPEDVSSIRGGDDGKTTISFRGSSRQEIVQSSVGDVANVLQRP